MGMSNRAGRGVMVVRVRVTCKRVVEGEVWISRVRKMSVAECVEAEEE